MWLAILGPLLVHDGETQVDVPKGRLHVLLAALLLHAGNPVTVGTLAEFMWDGAPPPSAAVTLRSHVQRLRRALGPRAGARLVTRHPGYMLQAGEDEVDVLRFRGLCRDGRVALREGAWARANGLLGEALALWRGSPLADVPSELLLREEVPGLEELRLQAEEWQADTALRLGRHDELVARLQSLAVKYPLREGFHAQLMLALYRCGRQAEALAAYQHARHILIDQLGAEPGPELQQLHQHVLSADPALAAPEPAASARGTGPSLIPRELPSGVPHFTGRTQELATLTRLLDEPSQEGPGTVVISAIGGTAGVGKTALAVHWARHAAGRFPDGQLFVNLRGYDPGKPMPTADALAGFLRSLGVSGQDIPPEEDDRTARYRSLMAYRRMLVVLDNAGSADQVRPLLPGNPACTVVVTSRGALAGLVARDGATRLDLDVLPLEEAIALLSALIGARVAAEPEAAAELASQCCRLPLALRVAAELAATRPAASLAGLTGELADLRTRLDLLAAGGDPRTEVRAVFSWSYRHLDAVAARTFRLLGLHPGPDLELYATAALTGTTVQQAHRALDVLARAHLIRAAAPGRHSIHDLLRAYARELTDTFDTGQEQHAALTRLFDHYIYTAVVAMDILYPAERHRRPRVPRPATPVPSLPDPAAAREWLNHERLCLVAAVRHTATHGWHSHATRLSATLSPYLRRGGHYPEAIAVHSHALGSAHCTGDRAAEATTLNNIGDVDWQQSRFQQATDRYWQALALFRAAGDRAGEAEALGNIGQAEMHPGRYEQAACHHQEAIVIYRDIGDRLGEARALGSLGSARRLQGRHQVAAGYIEQALDVCREIGDHLGEARALARLGVIYLRLGRYEYAAGYFRQALATFHEIGNSVAVSEIVCWLGEVYLRLGHYEQAAGNFEQALATFREIGDRDLEAEALNGLGEVLLQIGDVGKARAHHATALRLASDVGSPQRLARAHTGLARTCQADGDSLQARYHWQEALTRYEAIGAPEADEIRAQLAMVGDDKPTGEHGPSPDDLAGHDNSASSREPRSDDPGRGSGSN